MIFYRRTFFITTLKQVHTLRIKQQSDKKICDNNSFCCTHGLVPEWIGNEFLQQIYQNENEKLFFHQFQFTYAPLQLNI